MERNRKDFRPNRSNNISPWNGNIDSQSNYNQWNNSNIPNHWNNQQTMQRISPWVQNQNNRADPWQNNNSITWNQQSSTPQNNRSGGIWIQQTGNPNRRNVGNWSAKNNPNWERRTPYDRPSSDRNRSNRGQKIDRSESNSRERTQIRQRDLSPELQSEPIVSLTPLEAKIEKLITAVQSQPDNIGQLILLQNNNEIPPVLLNNAAHQVKNCVMAIDRDEATGYSKLRINSTIIAEGMYSSKKDAKEALYEMGLEILKNKCFYITSKSHYEEVSMNDINNHKVNTQEDDTMNSNSKALQMMLKMGWGGKGLGTKEQGEQKSVAEKIIENISREGLGLGGQSVMQEVDKILADYAKSNKTVTLGFDSGFTKEERAQIHSIAAKYHLKSKSEGGFNNRRITISKKMSKWVLVRELLRVGLENESYILTIPDDFQHLWTEVTPST
ncbi:homeobox protein 5-like [Diorhabda sublineata]|uniref:homeobox protein 5-like n=1 Tax=Diorhabda sublineata TaxID=1163346 RepID=UPI0024E16206|nr:homeobox protein 5-like [Diorhabda sublineata]